MEVSSAVILPPLVSVLWIGTTWGTLVQWLWKETRDCEVVCLYPGTVY